MSISVPWFSLPVGVPSVNLGGCSEATKRKWWPNRREVTRSTILRAVGNNMIPWYAAMSGGRLKCHAEKHPGFLAFGIVRGQNLKSTFAGETTFHPWIQHGIGTNQNFERNICLHFPGLLILMILGGYMGYMCQTSTYLVFRGCCGICSTLALPGQFRANLLQGTLPDWGSATDEVILVLGMTFCSFSPTEWLMRCECWHKDIVAHVAQKQLFVDENAVEVMQRPKDLEKTEVDLNSL